MTSTDVRAVETTGPPSDGRRPAWHLLLAGAVALLALVAGLVLGRSTAGGVERVVDPVDVGHRDASRHEPVGAGGRQGAPHLQHHRSLADDEPRQQGRRPDQEAADQEPAVLVLGQLDVVDLAGQTPVAVDDLPVEQAERSSGPARGPTFVSKVGHGSLTQPPRRRHLRMVSVLTP